MRQLTIGGEYKTAISFSTFLDVRPAGQNRYFTTCAAAGFRDIAELAERGDAALSRVGDEC
jgi:hypothetical protein